MKRFNDYIFSVISCFELKRGVFKRFCFKHFNLGKVYPNPLYDKPICEKCYAELIERVKNKI
jgi:hypothetical protein